MIKLPVIQRRRLPVSSILGIITLILSSCATDAEFLSENVFPAVNVTEQRARQELNCPDVTGFLLSKQLVNDASKNNWNKQAKYTVGTRGCGKQTVYFTFCRAPDDCNIRSKNEMKIEVLP